MKNLISIFIITFISLSIKGQKQIYYNNVDNGYRVEKKSSFYNATQSIINKNLIWSNAEKISDYSNEDSRDMDMAIDSNGTIHVVYCDDIPGHPTISRQRITYKSKPAGGTWSSPLIIDNFSGVSDRNNHEASMAVSPDGDVHVVFHYWAYDGTGRNQIGYSKYTKSTDSWTTELISGDSGTVFATYSDYPKIALTDANIPVAVWGNDNTNGYDEAYLTYNNGTWQSPIMISSLDSNKAQFPDIVSIGNNKVFILFREYDITEDTVSLYCRIFDASNGSLTSIKKVPETTKTLDYYYNYDASYIGNDSVFIALNIQDSIISYYYDILNDTIIKNPQIQKSNYTAGYTNYNLLSICYGDDKKIHFAYTVWNTNSNSVRYINYDKTDGFSTSEVVSVKDCIDKPQIKFWANKLHILYADDSEDTNNDGYVDREIYYVTADVPNKIKKQVFKNNDINIYPNPSNNGIFYIDLNEKSETLIMSLDGKVVKKINSKIIDISDLDNGMYICKITTNSGIYSKKIFKE